jgi:mercuric ion transport protein
MNNINNKPSKKGFYAAIAGIVLVALCCFTPILVITLGAIGLSAFTPYLDYVLMPAVIILIVVAWLSYNKFKKKSV